jgi:hypothetical protein
MLNKRVPWGKIEAYLNHGDMSYLRWAPGDCTAYDATVCYLGHNAGGFIGGDCMVSIRIGNKWKSVPLSVNDMGMISPSILEEHLFDSNESKELSHTTLYTLLIYAIMLNYSLFNNDMANEYIAELHGYIHGLKHQGLVFDGRQ